MYETRRVQRRVTSGHINIVVEDQMLPAFFSHPEGGKRYPGIVFLHHDWGLNGQIRAWTRRIAESGYYVIVPDLYEGQLARSVEESRHLREQTLESGPTRFAAAREVLQTHHNCNGKIGVIGWQMGGELAFQAAVRSPGLKAAVILSANPEPYLELVLQNQTPMLAFYGDADPVITPLILNQFSMVIQDSPGLERMIVYPGVSAEYIDERSSNYHAAYAAKTWMRMLDFLSEHLDPPLEQRTRTPEEDEEVMDDPDFEGR